MKKGIKLNRAPRYMTQYLEKYARLHNISVNEVLLDAIEYFINYRGENPSREELKLGRITAHAFVDIDNTLDNLRSSILYGDKENAIAILNKLESSI